MKLNETEKSVLLLTS